ncbi:unnamed protein product [Tilletia caries]|nr:unnamed protein product [Tilletia caries]
MMVAAKKVVEDLLGPLVKNTGAKLTFTTKHRQIKLAAMQDQMDSSGDADDNSVEKLRQAFQQLSQVRHASTKKVKKDAHRRRSDPETGPEITLAQLRKSRREIMRKAQLRASEIKKSASRLIRAEARDREGSDGMATKQWCILYYSMLLSQKVL